MTAFGVDRNPVKTLLEISKNLESKDILNCTPGIKMEGCREMDFDVEVDESGYIVSCMESIERLPLGMVDGALKRIARSVTGIVYFYIKRFRGDEGRPINQNADWWTERIERLFVIDVVRYYEDALELMCHCRTAKHKEPRKKTACYDLSIQPTTFDFATFLVVATTMGAEHIRFTHTGKLMRKDYSEEESLNRFENIVVPMCKLAGVSNSIGSRRGVCYEHSIGNVLGVYSHKGFIKKLIPTRKLEKSGFVTVTLRRSRKPQRNSNVAEWNRFIAWCDKEVVVIPDYADEPISIEDRMNLYCASDMNLGVLGGPSILCFYSGAPIIEMKYMKTGNEWEGNHRFHGTDNNFQFPFATRKQRYVAKEDTFENIRDAYLEA
ncbi:MAG: hypothetical protein NUW00_03890, partial [Candidatus Kaiserbacteria bacterium]|nr:hypothetical protein [Candidatus Kaiserbacteria bacterium]